MAEKESRGEQDRPLQATAVISRQGSEGRQSLFSTQKPALFPLAVQFHFQKPFVHARPPVPSRMPRRTPSKHRTEEAFLRVVLAKVPLWGRKRQEHTANIRI